VEASGEVIDQQGHVGAGDAQVEVGVRARAVKASIAHPPAIHHRPG